MFSNQPILGRLFALAIPFLMSIPGGESASAGTILKADFGNGGADLEFSGGKLFTPDDGDGATLGLQNTSVNFSAFLDGALADLSTGASLTIDHVMANGNVIVFGSMLMQNTLGGTFSLFGAFNELLLAGTLDEGMITGVAGSGMASFMTTSPVTFTGGSLLPLVDADSGSLSILLGNIQAGNQTGMLAGGNSLAPFTATATGQIDAMQVVPEPASILAMSGILGLVAVGVWNRKRRLGLMNAV